MPVSKTFLLLIGVVCILAMGFFRSVNAADFRELAPPVAVKPTPEAEAVAAELNIGSWIWTTNYSDKQVCRLWRSFNIPATNRVKQAILRITADNLYRLYLDGREIGEGANWRNLTEYDLTWLLEPGQHVLAVEALNDSLEGGVLLGMRIQFTNSTSMNIVSDASWKVVPSNARRWQKKTSAPSDWPQATVVGVIGQTPWWMRPITIIQTPPLVPPTLRFWQNAWFIGIVLTLCVVALALSLRLGTQLAVQRQAQRLLGRERARIARDIHDELGAGLTQLVLQGEVAQTELPENSTARNHFSQLCERARSVSHLLDEVVWAVNSKRDTLRDFSTYLCKYAQTFLSATSIRCRLDVQQDMPLTGFDLPVRRSLFMAAKEALNNSAKHSGATELFLRIFSEGNKVTVVVEDNGNGFDPATINSERNGLANMYQRLAEMGGECQIFSAPGMGCRVEFKMPLAHPDLNGSSSLCRWMLGRSNNHSALESKS
jgi:signal transduction histidine kinase